MLISRGRFFRQAVEDRRPSLGVGMRGHQPARLVIEKQSRALALGQRHAVDRDDVALVDVECRGIDHHTVDGDAALPDPLFGLAARAQAGACHQLGDALAGFFGRRRRCLAAIATVARRKRLALAIGAAAAERGALLEHWPRRIACRVALRLIARLRWRNHNVAARMIAPGVAAARHPVVAPAFLARTVIRCTLATIAREAWTFTGPLSVACALVVRAITARFIAVGTIVARLVPE